jgi:hypothetical protein
MSEPSAAWVSDTGLHPADKIAAAIRTDPRRQPKRGSSG